MLLLMRRMLALVWVLLFSLFSSAIPFAQRSVHSQGRRLGVPSYTLKATEISGGYTTDGTGKKRKKKVLILMSDTGGGHRASAQALDQALNETFPGKIDVDIIDIWTDHATWPFNGFVPAYKFLANNPFLWRMSYFYARFPPTRMATEFVSDLTSRGRFEQAIAGSDPDMVVSVHPLCQHIPLPIVKDMNKVRPKDKLPINFVTVVTDLGGAHETWFDKEADFCFVPSNAVRDVALKAGLRPDQIVKHGLPVRPPFWRKPAPKAYLRQKLKLKTERKTVLLMGGGDGVGGLSDIAAELANTLRQAKEKTQMVVICGNNKKVAQQLEATSWPSSINVAVRGFCNNVDEYMGAADCLVTKAGPGTIAEAMTRGLPIVLSSFLPGQERGNVPYVVKGGFGVYSGGNPKAIAGHVLDFFTDEEMLARMSSNSLARSSSDATRNIANDIGHLVLRRNVRMPTLRSKYGK